MGKGMSQQKKRTGKGYSSSRYERAERKQGRRFLLVWVPTIIIVVLFFYAFVFDPPRPVGQPVAGISKGGGQGHPGEGTGKTYSVLLDDGRVVKLDGSQMGSFEEGRRLLVQEKVTLIFKRTSFSFVRYIE